MDRNTAGVIMVLSAIGFGWSCATLYHKVETNNYYTVEGACLKGVEFTANYLQKRIDKNANREDFPVGKCEGLKDE